MSAFVATSSKVRPRCVRNSQSSSDPEIHVIGALCLHGK